MVKDIIKNPMTIWLFWLFSAWKLYFQNRGKHLRIGYLTRASNVSFGRYNTLYDHVTLGNTTIGDYVYISSNTKISNSSIGCFCSIGPNVMIGLGMHPTNMFSTFPAFYSLSKQCQVTFSNSQEFEETGKNIIGNDVWIGANVLILDNVNIGDGAIIAAGSVVTKDVPPYSIYGGVPARKIKNRFPDEKILKLLEFKWWERDAVWIKNNLYFLKSLTK